MSYPGFAQRLCLLSLAAAMATLFLLATTVETEAQQRCRPGYQWTQQGCVKVACGRNMVLQNGQCFCVQGYVRQGNACVRRVVRKCGPYQVRRGSRCVCAQGYVRQGGACVAAIPPCGPNAVRQGRQCVCVQGYVRQGSACVAALPPCGAYAVRQGRQCVCVQGYVRQGGACVAALPPCGSYEVRQGRQCVCAQGFARGSDGSCRQEVVCRGRYEVKRDGRCACAEGYSRGSDGSCRQEIVCRGRYEVRHDNRCVCEDGYARRDGACVRVVVLPPVIPPIPGGPGREPPPGPPPAAGGTPPAPPSQARGTDFVPGQLLVGFESQSDLQEVLRELERAQRSGGISARGARSTSVRVDRIGTSAIRIRLDFRTASGERLSGRTELAALQDYARRLTQRSSAAFAHPNWIMGLDRTLRLEQLSPKARVQSTASLPGDASDPALRTGLMWHYQAPPKGMNAAAAWSLNKGSRDVVVAVVDSGILPNHPDIKGSGNVLAGYNFITNPEEKGGGTEGPDPDSTDRRDSCSEYIGNSWHGTHVAGTIGAAQSNNDLGIVGVNWAVSVLPVRAMGRCGTGTIADIAGAITWAAGLPVPGVPRNEHKAHIINLSLSVSRTCQLQNVGLLKQALDDARDAGVIVVAAAGNKKRDIKDVTPAGCEGVISVAASDARGHLAPYSNYGNVTVMAPGGNLDSDEDDDNRPDGIWSLVAPSAEFPSGVAAMQGTSMAAPHVSAAIALALSAKPELRGKPDEIERLLRRSLARRPSGACSKACGPGLLDAKAMLQPAATSSR